MTMTAGDAQRFIDASSATHICRKMWDVALAMVILVPVTVLQNVSHPLKPDMKLIITSLSLHPETLRPHVSRMHPVDDRLGLHKLISVLSDPRHVDSES